MLHLEHSAILLTCIKQISIFSLFESGRFTQVLLYFVCFSIAENLRSGFGFSTDYAKFSEYDKLEKALLSGLPNEVDFVVNVCTLLSNESKHTLKLGKSRHLTDLLLAHIGVFQEGKLNVLLFI